MSEIQFDVGKIEDEERTTSALPADFQQTRPNSSITSVASQADSGADGLVSTALDDGDVGHVIPQGRVKVRTKEGAWIAPAGVGSEIKIGNYGSRQLCLQACKAKKVTKL